VQLVDYQRRLQRLGLYAGPLDGIAGNGTDAGFDAVFDFYEKAHQPKAAEPLPAIETSPVGLAWGAKVSPTFRNKVRQICEDPKSGLGCLSSWLMACIAWESGESFAADKLNLAGSGAIGLIQFMPSTAKSLGTTTAALGRMTPEQQLDYVAHYLAPWRGKIHSLSDLYMTILWPAGVGKPEDFPLFSGGVTYRQNAGLDLNRDKTVTKAEAAACVAGMLTKGMRYAA
jgi:hypothetical protein